MNSSRKTLLYVPHLKGRGNVETILRYIRDLSLVRSLKEEFKNCTVPSDESIVEQKAIFKKKLEDSMKR